MGKIFDTLNEAAEYSGLKAQIRRKAVSMAGSLIKRAVEEIIKKKSKG